MKYCSLLLFLFLQEDYVVKRIRFYEGPDADIPREQRQYSTVFPQSSARFIWCEVEVRNLLHKKREQPHTIRYEYYNPDGSLRGEMEGDFTIKSEWVLAWHQQGWGWHEPGKWPAGTYRVVVLMDDEKIGEREFTIAGGEAQYRLLDIRCFEAGRAPPEKDKRSYQTIFDQGSARYIWCEVEVQNLLHDVRHHSHKIAWKYFNEENEILGEIESDFTIQKVWTRAWHQSGWGWPDAGNWSAGAYRVEVFIDGKKVGQKKFTIAPAPEQ
jgi:hypothetical protein